MGTKNYDSATDMITFSRASSATFLGSNGLLQTAANNIPRIEYDAAGAVKGLLIEEARTNFVAYSEDFTNAAWNKTDTTVTPDATIAPDGTTTADLLTEGTLNSTHRVYQTVSLTGAGERTVGKYVKYIDAQWCYFRLDDNAAGNAYAYFDVLNGVTGTTNTDRSTITDVGNGWYYITASLIDYKVGSNSNVLFGIASADNTPSYTGTGRAIYVWGAQLELGSFASSYIPTSGATASRAADVATIPTSAFGYNSGAGTVVVEASLKSSSYPNSANIVSLADASNTDTTRLWVWSGADSTMRWSVYEGGVDQVDQTKPYTKDQLFSVAGAYKVNDFAISLDGSAVSTDTSGSVTSDVASLHIGTKTGGTEFMSGHIKSIQYYPRRLTNAQLQELTT